MGSGLAAGAENDCGRYLTNGKRRRLREEEALVRRKAGEEKGYEKLSLSKRQTDRISNARETCPK